MLLLNLLLSFFIKTLDCLLCGFAKKILKIQFTPPLGLHTYISQTTEQNQNKKLTSQQLTHQMITKSKCGIFKPKLYTAVLPNSEPNTVREALNDQNWYRAMRDEYKTLIRNETWSLVPDSAEYKVIGNKWDI